MIRLPLPGYPGFTYEHPSLRQPTRAGELSPIFGPSGRRLRTYRVGARPKLYVKLAGTLVPLDNALPAAPNEEWRQTPWSDCANLVEVSSLGRVRKGSANRRPRLLVQVETARGPCVRLDGEQVPVSSLVAEVFGDSSGRA